MVNWYVKGGSVFDNSSCKLYFYLDLGGYDKDDYETRDDSHIQDEDPYIHLGGAGGAKTVVIGLYTDYRIEIDNVNGIRGWDEVGGSWVDLLGGGIDEDAIHDNVANEITAITPKTSLASADEFILEDSGVSFIKKAVTFANIQSSISLANLGTRNHGSLSDAPTSAHHVKYTNSEAVSAVEAEAGLDLKGNLIINTITLTEPFYVTRAGGATQAIVMAVDDTTGYLKSVQDENEAGTYGSLSLIAGNKASQTPSINFGISNSETITSYTNKMDITSAGVRIGATGARVTQIENNDALGTSDTKLCTQGNVKAYHDAHKTVAGDLNHNDLANLNAGDVYEHISQAQKNALHTIYSLEVHNNTHHDPDYKQDFSENTAFNKNFGNLGTEVCVGNDARLSDARTPTAHVLATTGPHTGTLPWGDLNKTSSSLAHLATRTHANLSDAPADAHHNKQHLMDDITQHTRADNAVLNASTSFHGFLKKLDNVSTHYMNGQGNWATPPGSVEDDVYGSGWNGDTTHAPSQNAVYDYTVLQHWRDLGAMKIIPQDWVTIGDTNVYQTNSEDIIFGKTSKTNSHKLILHYELPEDYVAGQSIQLRLAAWDGSSGDIYDYKMDAHYMRSGISWTLADSEDLTWNIPSSWGTTYKTITITCTNVQPNDFFRIQFYMEDDNNVNVAKLNKYNLRIPVNKRS